MSEIEEIRARHEAGERASAADDREWLLGEVERLRRALAFYADQRSYKTSTVHMCGHPVGQPVVVDGGEQARKALEGGR